MLRIPSHLDADASACTHNRLLTHQYHRSNPHNAPPRLTDQHAPAVSSLEDCPTPAHQTLRARIVARTRAGDGQSLTRRVGGRQNGGSVRQRLYPDPEQIVATGSFRAVQFTADAFGLTLRA